MQRWPGSGLGHSDLSRFYLFGGEFFQPYLAVLGDYSWQYSGKM